MLVAHPGGQLGLRVALVGGDPLQLGGAGAAGAGPLGLHALAPGGEVAFEVRDQVARREPEGSVREGLIYVRRSVVSKEWLKVALCTPAHKYGGGV